MTTGDIDGSQTLGRYLSLSEALAIPSSSSILTTAVPGQEFDKSQTI